MLKARVDTLKVWQLSCAVAFKQSVILIVPVGVPVSVMLNKGLDACALEHKSIRKILLKFFITTNPCIFLKAYLGV